jgi:predicted nucleic acid-binding protein
MKIMVDIILSGDRHFLDLKMEHPEIMSVSEFLDDEAMSTPE